MNTLPDFVQSDRIWPVERPKGVVRFEVLNNRVNLTDVPEALLAILDKEFRYPTPMVDAFQAGFVDLNESGWDGWIRLLRRPKTIPTWFPTGLLGRALSITTKFGYALDVRDTRKRPMEDIPEFAKIPLRDYQLEAVQKAIAAGRGVLDLPPRAGKTRLMVEIVRRLALNTIWIAPTDRIVRQTLEVLQGFLGEWYAMHLIGSGEQAAAAKKRVVVCTAATAANLSPEFFQTRDVLVMDEFHHAGSKQGEQIFKLCESVYYRFGMTGTFFRSGDDEMAMRALLSNVIYKATSTDLQQRGHLVPVKVVFLPVLGKKLRGVESAFITGHGKHGIHEHEGRSAMAANAAIILAKSGKKVLVLVGTKAQGKLLQKLIEPALPPVASSSRFRSCEFCSTDMDRKKIGGCIKQFLEDGPVRVLIGTSLLGEGVDLPSADALVYARGEQAEVTLVQNAYRVATAVPGKKQAVIVDFADRHHRKLLAHAQERLAVYCSDPIFGVTVLDDPLKFEAWLATL